VEFLWAVDFYVVIKKPFSRDYFLEEFLFDFSKIGFVQKRELLYRSELAWAEAVTKLPGAR
jgi:hypothetical protein